MKINITRGTYGESNASHLHLVKHHLIDPSKGIDKVISYTEQRYLTTFLTAQVREGRYTAPGYMGKNDTALTRAPKVPEGELTKSLGWKYKVQGRIQKACEILGTGAVGTVMSGTTSTGGFFSLTLKDKTLAPNMNVRFYSGHMARVVAKPTGSPNNYVYRFQCRPGDTFTWATWISGQSGSKTCFGGFTSVGERSVRGFDTMFYPDEFMNHMTTERKSLSISGDANTEDVLWYELNGEKGWVYEAEAQARARFLIEDEDAKFWGQSNMKDANGNLLNPTEFDDETGEPITRGDGWTEQVIGSNDMEASGTDGAATYDDFAELMTTSKKRSNNIGGNLRYMVTGADGMDNALTVLETRAIALGMKFNVENTDKIGGASPAVGFNFKVLNIGGDQAIFVENPLMNDEQRFPRRLSNGKSAMGMTYYMMDLSNDSASRPNVEIRARGKAGINRNFVYYMKNGMTGEGKAESPVDAKEIHMLKQSMLVVYDTRTSGILEPSATA